MAELDALLALQELDTAADQLRHRRAALPERLALTELDAAIDRLDAEAAAVHAERDPLAAEQARLDAQVADSETKQASITAALRRTSVPREAQAMSTELEALKARQRDLEDRELDLMEQLEPLDARLAELAAQRDDASTRRGVAVEALAEAEAEVDRELMALGERREAAVAAVLPALLTRYERLRAKLGGVAVARLQGNRCTGCNLTLPAMEIDRIRHLPPDELVECEQCGRLLVR